MNFLGFGELNSFFQGQDFAVVSNGLTKTKVPREPVIDSSLKVRFWNTLG